MLVSIPMFEVVKPSMIPCIRSSFPACNFFLSLADKLNLEQRLHDNLIEGFKKAKEEEGKDPCTLEQLREFFTNIHCVYNEYPTDGFHPGIIHYNGTATAFDPVSTGKQLLNLAKNEDLDGIKALMSLTRYVKRITHIFPK
jgi:hypothetical protein